MKKSLMAAAGVALLAGLVYFEGPGTILGALVGADQVKLLLAEVLLLAIGLLKGFRFGTIAKGFGEIGMLSSYNIFYFGQLVNQGIASAAGDVSKAVLLQQQHSFVASRAVSSVVTERMFDFVVLLAIADLFLLGLPYKLSLAALIGLTTAAVLGLLTVVVLPERPITRLGRWRRIHALLMDFRSGVRGLGKRVAVVGALTVTAWVIDGMVMVLLLGSLGVEAPLLVVTAVVAISMFAGFASMVPGGIGTREAVMLLLYAQFGVPGGVAVAAALIYRFMAAANDTAGYLVTSGLSR